MVDIHKKQYVIQQEIIARDMSGNEPLRIQWTAASAKKNECARLTNNWMKTSEVFTKSGNDFVGKRSKREDRVKKRCRNEMRV